MEWLKEHQTEVLYTLVPISVVIIAWLLQVISTIRQEQGERKRILRSSLTWVVDMHWHLMRLDVSFVVDCFLSEAKRRSLFNEKGDEESMLRDMLVRYVSDVATEFGEADFKRIQTRYESAITRLSEVDPLLSFQLSVRSDFASKLKSADNLFQNLSASIRDEEMTKTANKLIEERKSKLVSIIVDDTATIARQIGRKIGVITWYRVWRTLKNMKESREQDAIDFVRTWLDGFGNVTPDS